MHDVLAEGWHQDCTVVDPFESDIDLLGRLLDRGLSGWTERCDETCLGEVSSA